MKKIYFILTLLIISLYNASANQTLWSMKDEKTDVTFSMVITNSITTAATTKFTAYVHDASNADSEYQTLVSDKGVEDYLGNIKYGHQFNNGGLYWVHYTMTDTNSGDNYDSDHNEVKYGAKTGSKTNATVHYYPVTAYTNSSIGTVKVSCYSEERGYMSNSTKTRTLKVLVNNVQVKSETILCPSTFPDDASKLVATAGSGYFVHAKTYDSSSQTFTVEYRSKYSVTFNGNGGTPASSSLTSSATFKGWEDHSTFTYPDDGSS